MSTVGMSVRAKAAMHCSAVSLVMRSVRSGPASHMAVATGLVAELAHIDLEDRDAGRLQRRQATVPELFLKCPARPDLCEHFQLFGRSGKRFVLAHERQCHREVLYVV